LNIAGIYGLEAAVNYLLSIGMENIEAHERDLKKYAVERLEKTGKVTLYNADAPTGIVTFNVDGVFAQDEATLLNSKGIACRSGQHCAKMLPEDLGTVATVRASFYLYTTREDIDALVDVIEQGGDFLDAYF
ncbi:MAG: aminotransferase class V-fold PLP-dependent enzyme, partial [Bacilli bacterium]|nr:aminotransferase class V-fold PLP-dependent enzyme [Bacilli bacterium]